MNVCAVSAHVLLNDVLNALSTHKYIEPKQVVSLLWSLPCEDTDAYMRELTHRYKKPDYAYQENVVFIQHCRGVHRVLKHLYVDERWHALVYKEQTPPAQLTTLINYWKQCHTYSYLDFYRLYADALSVAIVQVLHRAYMSLDDPEWKDYSARAQVYLNDFKEISHYFTHTEYEVLYTQALHRYQALIALLRDQQAKQGVFMGICVTDSRRKKSLGA